MAEKSKRDETVDGVEVEELMAQIDNALDKIPLEDLLIVIETAKRKYESRHAAKKESLIAEFQERAKRMGLSPGLSH